MLSGALLVDISCCPNIFRPHVVWRLPVFAAGCLGVPLLCKYKPLMRERMKSKLLLISVVIPAILVTCYRDTAPQKLPWSQELQDALDNGLKTNGGTGVSAAVILAGKGEWAGVSGMSDPKASESIQPDMVFDVASVGKTFTAALVLQLVEEGKLSLDDSLHKWLPDFPNINNNATIRQLLNHTSGISHFSANQQDWSAVFADPDSLWAPEDVLRFVPEPRFGAVTAAR
jgi:CubicO group peptidase (beta-lactamase class C family)